MSATLKYQTSFDELNLTDCPQKNAIGKDCEAFRFCFDTLEHPDTWITQAEKFKREGTFPRENTTTKRLCDSFGLSFFITERAANAVWKAFSQRVKGKMGYTSLGKGQLLKTDGLCSPTENSGHFNFFEFDQCNLSNRFVIHSKL